MKSWPFHLGEYSDEVYQDAYDREQEVGNGWNLQDSLNLPTFYGVALRVLIFTEIKYLKYSIKVKICVAFLIDVWYYK